ncbi:hypothetical protein D3C75_1065710 [compost metagenome]
MHYLHSSIHLADPVYRACPPGLHPVQIQFKADSLRITLRQEYVYTCCSVQPLKFKIMIMINELQTVLLL